MLFKKYEIPEEKKEEEPYPNMTHHEREIVLLEKEMGLSKTGLVDEFRARKANLEQQRAQREKAIEELKANEMIGRDFKLSNELIGAEFNQSKPMTKLLTRNPLIDLEKVKNLDELKEHYKAAIEEIDSLQKKAWAK